MPIITDAQLEFLVRKIAHELSRECNPQGYGFGIFLFQVDNPAKKAFASNVDREKVVAAMGRWIDKERAE